MSKTIYIVMGETGEYSDHNEWPVCWRDNKADAEALVAKLNEQAAEYQRRFGSYVYAHSQLGAKEFAATMIDRRFQCDFNGAEYHVWAVSDDPAEALP